MTEHNWKKGGPNTDRCVGCDMTRAPWGGSYLYLLETSSHSTWTDILTACTSGVTVRVYDSADYPHACPTCGCAAYVGLSRVACTTSTCPNYDSALAHYALT